MLQQLMHIKQRRERGFRNELNRVLRLRQQVEQEIILLQQRQREIQNTWQLACIQFMGKIDHKDLVNWQEKMRSYQLKYENIGQQILKQQQQYAIFSQNELQLQEMLKQVLISQEKINYIISAGIDN